MSIEVRDYIKSYEDKRRLFASMPDGIDAEKKKNLLLEIRWMDLEIKAIKEALRNYNL